MGSSDHFYEFEGIEALHSAGAQFVVTRGGRAFWSEWQNKHPSIDTLRRELGRGKGYRLGVIPASLGASVLDVDHGDYFALASLCKVGSSAR